MSRCVIGPLLCSGILVAVTTAAWAVDNDQSKKTTGPANAAVATSAVNIKSPPEMKANDKSKGKAGASGQASGKRQYRPE